MGETRLVVAKNAGMTMGAMDKCQDGLVVAAMMHGPEGVRAYLQENRQHLADLLLYLATPVELDHPNATSTSHPGGAPTSTEPLPPSVGIRLESLDAPVQRELWSAFVRWHKRLLPPRELHVLVQSYLATVARSRSRDGDAVCMHLAQLLLRSAGQTACAQGDADEEQAFDMRDGVVILPTQQTEEDALDAHFAQLVYVPMRLHGRVLDETMANDGDQETHVEPPSPDARSRKRPRHDGFESNGDSAIAAVDRIDTGSQSLLLAPLSTELETRATSVAKQINRLGVGDAHTEQAAMNAVSDQVLALLRTVMDAVGSNAHENDAHFAALCGKLPLAAMSDELLFQLTTALMQTNWSSRYATVFLHASVLPKILAATSVISRILLQTALLYAKPSYEAALTNGLLVPLLTAPGIGAAQGEALTRMLREHCIPVDQLDAFIRQVLETPLSSTTIPDTSTPLLANEPTMLVFQNALNLRPTLLASTVERLVHGCASALEFAPAAAQLPKSSKFATLVFTLVSKYSDQCFAHLDELEALAKALTSVMARTALRAIQRLGRSKR